MKKVTLFFFTFILLVGLMGCGNKDEKDKKEVKKETKQTVQTTQRVPKENISKKFNHSASLKITQIISEMSEIQDPVAVVYNKAGILAYKTNGEVNPEELEKKIKQKLKAQMPDYQIRMNSNPEWYQQVAVLHQDTIDSEGRIVKDLRKTFINLKDNKQ